MSLSRARPSCLEQQRTGWNLRCLSQQPADLVAIRACLMPCSPSAGLPPLLAGQSLPPVARRASAELLPSLHGPAPSLHTPWRQNLLRPCAPLQHPQPARCGAGACWLPVPAPLQGAAAPPKGVAAIPPPCWPSGCHAGGQAHVCRLAMPDQALPAAHAPLGLGLSGVPGEAGPDCPRPPLLLTIFARPVA